ncbi:MAG: hypothetical protein WCQ50_09330 [Spirochaetota bacterium]
MADFIVPFPVAAEVGDSGAPLHRGSNGDDLGVVVPRGLLHGFLEAGSHEALAGDGEGDATRIDGDPAAAPLFGNVGGDEVVRGR